MLAALTIQMLLAGLTFGDVSERVRKELLPSSTKYQGLDPPLEFAAANPVQKSLHSNAKDDEDNLERLCNDPFHSFLCKPVTTRRRRINGRLRPGAVIPTGIVPEASNVQESSQPLESHPEGGLRQGKSYLPPFEAKVPRKQIEPQFLPPSLITRKFTEPPIVERTQESKISYSTVPKSKNVLKLDEIEKTQKKIEEQPPSFGQKLRTQPDNTFRESKQIPLSKLPRKYLPIDETVSPDSSNLSPSLQTLPLVGLAAQNQERKDESHSLERLCNDPFHSFLCKPGKRRKRIDGRIRPGAMIPSNILVASSSILRESRVLPSQLRSARQPANFRGARDNYLPPDPDKPLSTNRDNGYYYDKPSSPLPSSQTALPAITTGSTSEVTDTIPTSPQTVIQQDIVPPSSGYQYVPPANGLTLPTSPPLTTQTLPPNPDTPSAQETVDSSGQNGYNYPEPSSAPSTTVQVVQTSLYSTDSPQGSTNVPSGVPGGYNYPKPSNPLTLPSTTLSTATARPEEPTTELPSSQSPDAQTTLVPSSGGYTYPKPSDSNKQPNPPDQQQTSGTESGYNYEKPSVQLTLPAATNNTFATPTTRLPASITTETVPTTFGYQYPKPSNTQENIVSPNQSGYSYSKPSIGFTYPTTQRPETTQISTTSRPTIVTTTRPAISITTAENPTTGYQYPKHTINQDIAVPSGQSGYNYPNPSVSFTYPASNQSQTVSIETTQAITTTSKPVSEASDIQNAPAGDQNGYIYEKPADASKPTNINQDIVPPTEGGYVYDKPTDSTTTKPETTSTAPTYITSITNLPTTMGGYQYPKPSNGQTIAESASQNGYIYKKPDISFTLPSSGPATATVPTIETTNPEVTTPQITTKQTTGYEYPNPSNDQPDVLTPPKEPGYNYSKPSSALTYPTTLSTERSSPTVTTAIIVPTTTQQTTLQSQSTSQVTKQTTGYNYQRPQPSFTYPRPTLSTTTYTRPVNSFQYPKPNFPQAPSSFQYGYEYRRPTASPTPPTADEGYHYRRPANPLTLPPRQRSARNYRGYNQFPTRRDFDVFTF